MSGSGTIELRPVPAQSEVLSHLMISPSPCLHTRALLIVNPTAGHYSDQRLAEFVRHLEKAGLDVQVMKTRHRGHATRIVQDHLTRTDLIIAGGGDGTIAEIAQAMMDSSCPLALWPVGSANVLALELEIPFHDARNAALIASGQSRTLWAGWMGSAAAFLRPQETCRAAGLSSHCPTSTRCPPFPYF
ncbi:acylglycerol kinase family protein [Bombella sp. TMW 2.2559]|uniref:Acylglycerol kinase family protein n=1 Tax=Bombella dulcis TaxID=2967339 RepID=A0ABT3WC42_9PROT|nr:acylglycerol kinase family protein [Bombella dulcis]MCX5616662.1 acylglycerol kinase family protein [Bombella dulcis]